MPPTPTVAEVAQLIAAVPAGAVYDRDRTLLELLLGCGLTTGELARAQRGDVQAGTIMVRGSRTRTRTVSLTNQATFYVERYLHSRRDNSPHLFVRHDRALGSNRPGQLTPRSIQRTIERYRKIAGIKLKITPASFRRAFVQRIISHGTSIELVRKLLGHSHPVSTRRLINLVSETTRPAII